MIAHKINIPGKVNQSLIRHPDGEHLVYAVGSAVVIRSKNNSNAFQDILQGHSNNITCLAVSSSGKYIASGQITHMGYQV
jgi:WD40 repeat protein